MARLGPIKILVVDDSPAVREVVRQFWTPAEALILEAASGEEAILRYSDERPDWVVMDLRMPGMGGLRAMEAIRRLDHEARIIAMSQFVEPECATAARRAGALQFVNKEDLLQITRVIQP